MEVPTKDRLRFTPVEMMVDLESNDPVKCSPPSEKVIEEIAVGQQLGERASPSLGVGDSNWFQDVGLRGHCRSIGRRSVSADLVEEDEIELARMCSRPGPIGQRPAEQALLKGQPSRCIDCNTDVGFEGSVALDDQLGEQLGETGEVGVDRRRTHPDFACDPTEGDRARSTLVESPARLSDYVLLELSALSIASALGRHAKHVTLNTVKLSSAV